MRYLLLFMMISSAATAQLGSKVQSLLPGRWINNEYGYTLVLELKADGSGTFDGETIRYKILENKQLEISGGGSTNRYDYSFDGKQLQLKGGDIEGVMRFVREGQQQSAPKAENTAVPVSATGLVGSWQGHGETVRFYANGQCSFQGMEFNYQQKGNQLIFSTQQGSVQADYQLEGDRLTMILNGQTYRYSREGSGQANGVAPSLGASRNPAELAGKWCYVYVQNVTTNSGGGTGGSSSEECIVIQADGSYTFNSERSMSTNTEGYWGGTNSSSSDQGSWWVENGRLYYRSARTGQQGSFALEKVNHPRNNDPMLVLDGKTYVTQYQKAPW